MDINKTLREALNVAAWIQKENAENREKFPIEKAAEALCRHLDAIDVWLSTNGELPQRWLVKRFSVPTLRQVGNLTIGDVLRNKNR